MMYSTRHCWVFQRCRSSEIVNNTMFRKLKDFPKRWVLYNAGRCRKLKNPVIPNNELIYYDKLMNVHSPRAK
jgi:hypothetical protein